MSGCLETGSLLIKKNNSYRQILLQGPEGGAAATCEKTWTSWSDWPKPSFYMVLQEEKECDRERTYYHDRNFVNIKYKNVKKLVFILL